MGGDRNLLTLIRAMRNFIPEEYKTIHGELDKCSQSVLYTPPECMPDMFVRVACALSEIPCQLEKETWYKAVLSIWRDEKFSDVL